MNFLIPSNQAKDELISFGDLVVSPTYLENMQMAAHDKPWLEQFDAYGKRIDKIHTNPGWGFFKNESARNRLICQPYSTDLSNKDCGSHRIMQVCKLHLFHASSSMFSCPLAMTDGATTVIRNILKGNKEQYEKETISKLQNAYNHLTSSDPTQFWTSGQWMTEKRGGSDVGNSTDTVAVKNKGDDYKLYGFKWFTSAIDADMTLTLARSILDKKPVNGTKGLNMYFA
jgi:hypothetical protein